MKANSTPRLCLGTAQLGMPYGIANKTGVPERSEIRSMIACAIESGVSFLDTAQSYGESERAIGTALATFPSVSLPGVVSKLDPKFTYDGPASLEASLRASLERLRIPALWGFLLHRPDPKYEKAGFIAGLERLKSLSLVEKIGISVYEPRDALYYARIPWVDAIQVPHNIVDRRLLDLGFFDEAKDHGKTVFLRSLFLQGLLLVNSAELAAKGMGWADHYLQGARAFAKRHGLDMRSFAFEAVTRKWPDCIAIFGAESLQQVRENTARAGGETVPEGLIDQWWAEVPRHPDGFLNPILWKRD